VLLVEDSYNDELLARRAFEKCRMADRLAVARDGAEALDFLHGRGARGRANGTPMPALVLLDLKLPKLDGIEVLRRVRADDRTRDLPVVMFTSSDEEADRAECHRLGANGYVRKPVRFSEFVETVRELGLCWLKLDGKLL